MSGSAASIPLFSVGFNSIDWMTCHTAENGGFLRATWQPWAGCPTWVTKSGVGRIPVFDRRQLIFLQSLAQHPCVGCITPARGPCVRPSQRSVAAPVIKWRGGPLENGVDAARQRGRSVNSVASVCSLGNSQGWRADPWQ
jgi:hypothetical protein